MGTDPGAPDLRPPQGVALGWDEEGLWPTEAIRITVRGQTAHGVPQSETAHGVFPQTARPEHQKAPLRRPAFAWGPLWMLLWVLWAGTLAQAHPLIQNPLWVLLEPGRAQVAVQVTLREIAAVQGVAAEASPESLALAARKHGAYVLEHLTLGVGGRVLTGEVRLLTAPAVVGDGEKTFFQYELNYQWAPTAPGPIRISQRMLEGLSETPGQPWDVSYVVRLKRGASAPAEAFLLRRSQNLDLPVAAPTGEENVPARSAPAFFQYLLEGVWHILTGYDHLLFVCALLMAALSFWEMVRVVAAFTAAHSLTLALSALDLVRLPESVVEPLIAASIVVGDGFRVWAYPRTGVCGWPARCHAGPAQTRDESGDPCV